MSSRFAILLLCVVASSPAPLVAQVAVGERVQLSLPEQAGQPDTPWRRGMLIRGSVDRLAGDTLHLRVEGATAPLPVPFTAIRTAWRSRGVPSRAASALRRGLETGLIVGLFAFATYNVDRWDFGQSSRAQAGVAGAAIGALAGAVHGALFPAERWREVRLGR